MEELRFVRREEQTLVVSNDAGEEYRLLVDDAILVELKHLSRRDRLATAIRPREIQALLRSGKSRSQVAQQTGLEETDVERYEEPVLAERRYILELAHAVAVHVDPTDETVQHFGSVIEQRLRALEAEATEWTTWREEGADWQLSVEFISRENAHRAVWSFDHRKSVLTPANTDAENLSKQGDIGERLIPKLRVVDQGEQQQVELDAVELPAADFSSIDSDVRTSDAPVDDPNLEYARRREIDHLAISSDEDDSLDLSQTADLLDALRRRKGERERELLAEAAERHPSNSSAVAPDADTENAPDTESQPPRPNLWSVGGLASDPADESPTGADDSAPKSSEHGESTQASTAAEPTVSQDAPKSDASRKGRASVPSWDDILFGTRSDDDPV